MNPTRRTFVAVGLLMIAGTAIAAVPTASGTARAPAVGKPLIGRPVAVPVQPLAGKPFAVSFKVTRSDTGAPLTGAKMAFELSVSGKAVHHADSFRGGTARVSFLVPANAAGKSLKVTLRIKAGDQSATKVASFRILEKASQSSIAIGDASGLEGNSGTAMLSFPVTLSAASTQTVSVGYATSDGTAVAPGDYASGSGTVTFAPGETAKRIPVSIVGDTSIEPDETLSITIANPVNASIAHGTATGTITNDDVSPPPPPPAPVTPGSYKGATQEGNYVFFTVLPNLSITGFRANDLPESCDPPASLRGGVDWGTIVFPIAGDGSFVREERWSGSEQDGDVEWTSWYAKITGRFTGTSATGTILTSSELNYKGTHYKCSTAEIKWSAARES
jgi:Calx-beta domain